MEICIGFISTVYIIFASALSDAAGIELSVENDKYDTVMDELLRLKNAVEFLKTARIMSVKTTHNNMQENNEVVAMDDREAVDHGIRRKIFELRSEVERPKVEATQKNSEKCEKSGHATYIRWGRTNCIGNASTVYQGHAAGPRYTDVGGGSNFLCLHETPQWSTHVDGSSVIYGVEYRNHMFPTVNHGGVSLHGFPAAPCAVCDVARETVLMIPGRLDCPPGYAKEYQGIILSDASFDARRRTEYLCWDHEPESATGGIMQTQSVVYTVVVGCGSLPCSRFHNGRTLTCVVCSK